MNNQPTQQPILIDVRTPAEYAEGHYQGAVNHELDLVMAGHYPDAPRSAHIQVYCRSGNRSGIAKQILDQAGFTQVENIGAFNL
jgi:phage shock protein E